MRDYAKQETVGPLRGAWRWLGFGLVAAFFMGLGIVILLLGVLRLTQDLVLQTWWPEYADGLSFVPYVVTVMVGVVTSLVVLSRITVFELNRGKR